MEIDNAAERLATVVAAMPPGPSRLRFEVVLDRLRQASDAPPAPGGGAAPTGAGYADLDGPASALDGPAGALDGPAGAVDEDEGVADELDLDAASDPGGGLELDGGELGDGELGDGELDDAELDDPDDSDADPDDAVLDDGELDDGDSDEDDAEDVLVDLDTDDPVDAATTSDERVSAPWEATGSDRWSQDRTADTGRIPTVTAPVPAATPASAARPRPTPGPLPLPEKRGWWRRKV